ncbi:MAG: PD-(D/E)XK nuclease-like domain-containing protein [Pirellulales bacterium]
MNITQVWKQAPGTGGDVDWSSVLLREPADVYHAQSGRYLSSHRLAAFRECPMLYRKWQLGQIVDEDRPAYLVGRAAHTLILEGPEVFDDQYAVGGPINPKTGQPFGASTKAFADWAAEVGKPVLSEDQAELVQRMNDAVRSHELAVELLSDGIPEGVLRCDCHSLACQARLDWLAPDYGIVDLKTSDNLTWFEADARRYHYLHQLAFYRSIVTEVTGQTLPVYLIAVEKREPFRCGVWLVGQDALGFAERENTEAMVRLRSCMATDSWPTGYESLRTFDWL